MAKPKLEASTGWIFDFSEFNAEKYEQLNENLRNGAVTPLVEILQRIVVTCPHGDPQDESMWRALNVIQFLTLGKVIGDALNEEVKKFLAQQP